MSAKATNGLKAFSLLTGLLFLFRLVLGFVTVPPQVAPALSFAFTIVFLGLPILALFRASESVWTTKTAGLILLAGALVHVAGALCLSHLLPPAGPSTVVVQSLVQVGISLWTLGLGALVALMIKDKNLIVPIAIFLAGLDVFLVFNPEAWTSKIVRQNPAVFQSMAVKIPAARPTTAKPEGAKIVNQAFVGPADLLFIATFFVILARFQMRVRETVKWLLPVMVVYLLLVLMPQLGLSMLPALVPIGLTVLIVNRKEFTMSKEEKGMVWGAAALSLALAAFGLYRHFTYKPPAEPTVTSTMESGQSPPTQGGTPLPVSEGRSQ